MKRLENKVALITGAAAGIGLATAKLFLEEGARVMLVDINQQLLEKEVARINNPNVSYCVADVSKAKDTKNYVEETLKVFGKIDIFFNNAGIEGCSKPLVDYPEDIFDKVIAVNLKGVWLGCHYVLPKMEEGGSVMITSSVAGLKGFAGPVDNNMMRRIEKDISPENPEQVIKGFEDMVPLKRYAESQEIARLALFLASDESSYITGSMHVVDGGMLSS